MLRVQKSESIPGREYIDITAGTMLVRTSQAYSGGAVESDFRVMIDGVEVPKLDVGFTGDDSYQIALDGRYAFWIPNVVPETLDQILRLVANAMAIAAGFSCFGEGSMLVNPYAKYPMPGA